MADRDTTMKRAAEAVFRDREALANTCRRYRIKRLSVFGSVLKGARAT